MRLSQRIVQALKAQKKGTSPYDTTGIVTRIEGDTVWVHFAGGVDETPVSKTIDCSVGDTVQVRVNSHNTFLMGNATAPPTDDTTAIYARERASEARTVAQNAEVAAVEAQSIANEASATAREAVETAGKSMTTDTMHYLATSQSSGVAVDTQGWTTSIQTIDATNKYLWTYHTYTKANGQSYDSAPVIIGTYGVDGTSVTILGSYSTLAELEAAHPTGDKGDAYLVAGDLYVWNGTAWENVGQIKGDKGDSGTSVTVDSIRYAVSETENQPEDSAFTYTSVPTVAEGSWLWVRVVYSDGSKTYTKSKQGKTGAKGDSPVITATKSGTTTTLKVDGVTVATILDGADGATGHSPTITTQKSGNTTTIYADGASIGTVVDGNDGKTPTITASKSNGVTTVRANGTAIATINDGSSVIIQSATKTGSTTTVVLKDSAGTQTLTINDGEDGDNGTNGANGYVHVAWANSADGATDFSTSVSANKKYVGMYTDNTEADSQTPSKYNWSLIKGDKGDKGDTGEQGISITKVEPQYNLSTSTSSATGTWSDTMSYTAGKYIWTREKITFSNGNVGYSTAVYNSALTTACANALNANQIASNTNQYFWHTETGDDTGAHITEKTREAFLADPQNGGGNTIMRSNGMAVRDGLTEVASFGSSSAVMGTPETGRAELLNRKLTIYGANSEAGTTDTLVELGAGSSYYEGGTDGYIKGSTAAQIVFPNGEDDIRLDNATPYINDIRVEGVIHRKGYYGNNPKWLWDVTGPFSRDDHEQYTVHGSCLYTANITLTGSGGNGWYRNSSPYYVTIPDDLCYAMLYETGDYWAGYNGFDLHMTSVNITVMSGAKAYFIANPSSIYTDVNGTEDTRIYFYIAHLGSHTGSATIMISFDGYYTLSDFQPE